MTSNPNPRRGDNAPTPPPKSQGSGESLASKNYRAGRAYGYKYRIRGPEYPVTSSRKTPSALFDVIDEPADESMD